MIAGNATPAFFAAAMQRFPLTGKRPLPSFLCLSQESSRLASARRKEASQPKDLGWLDSCDQHRNEGEKTHPRNPGPYAASNVSASA
ncbi:hypothetical protein DC439_08110 [Agrobacterium tumefaciens]|nr:hypothetical protein DC439_08110 [Agrobacterium tumefaciens]